MSDVVTAMDVGELMIDPELGARGFTLRRSKPPKFANEGVLQPAYGETPMTGIVQPATAREIQLLPEGERLDAVISVWSADELRCGDGKLQQPDVLVIDGELFRVVKCEPWQQGGYWRAFAERFTP